MSKKRFPTAGAASKSVLAKRERISAHFLTSFGSVAAVLVLAGCLQKHGGADTPCRDELAVRDPETLLCECGPGSHEDDGECVPDEVVEEDAGDVELDDAASEDTGDIVVSDAGADASPGIDASPTLDAALDANPASDAQPDAADSSVQDSSSDAGSGHDAAPTNTCGNNQIEAPAEQCELGAAAPAAVPAAQWDRWTCRSATCQIEKQNYSPCNTKDARHGGLTCDAPSVCSAQSYCSPMCNNSVDCPAPPVGSAIPVCTLGVCLLAECRANGDCPTGTICKMTGSAGICMGCQMDSDCPLGKACVKRTLLPESAVLPTGLCK